MSDLDQLVLTAEEAAAALRITRDAIYRRIRRGSLPVVKDGRRTLIPREAIDRILRGRLDAIREGDSDRGPRGEDPRTRDINPCQDKQSWFSVHDRPNKGGSRWEVDFYIYHDGRTRAKHLRRRSPHASQADTQRWALHMLDHLGAPPKPPGETTPTLAQASARWLATQTCDCRNKRRHIDRLTGLWGAETMIDAIDYEQIVGLPARLKQPHGPQASARSRNRRPKGSGRRLRKGQGLAPGTARSICQTVTRILDFAFQMGWRNRADKVPLPKLPVTDAEWLTADELNRLLDVAGDYRIAFMLGARAGLRRGEIVELRWKDVDFPNRRLRVSRAYKEVDGVWKVASTKGGRPRTIKMPLDLATALAGVVGRPNELVASLNGERIKPERLTVVVPEAAKMCGIDRPGIGPHSLRHTFCSHLAQCGASTMAIQKLAGHASLRTTERYMHIAPSDIDDAIDRLPPLRGRSEEEVKKPGETTGRRPRLRLVPSP